jgi:hypothetical protein
VIVTKPFVLASSSGWNILPALQKAGSFSSARSLSKCQLLREALMDFPILGKYHTPVSLSLSHLHTLTYLYQTSIFLQLFVIYGITYFPPIEFQLDQNRDCLIHLGIPCPKNSSWHTAALLNAQRGNSQQKLKTRSG